MYILWSMYMVPKLGTKTSRISMTKKGVLDMMPPSGHLEEPVNPQAFT